MRTPTPTTGATLRQLAELNERVFPSYPQVARYFPSQSMEDARRRLGRAIERGDGPGLVIGAPGTGKSLLLQVLAAQYHERFDVVLLAVARICTRRALLQAVLFELGLPYKIRDEGELRLSLLDHLLSDDECPAGLLLLVDEAQTLPVALLDELRVMSNLVRGGIPRVRLVVAGSAALEEAFAHPELESFGQRLAARCYLAPLGRDETIHFVRAQLAASGGAPDEIFAADAWDAIFEATDGVPRLVNQLCDRALFFAAADNRQPIDRDVIQRAWSDLQQLPTPWDTPPASIAGSAVSQVVEFGGLNDDPATEV
ncbi:MAG: AAA family ATPase, partial [Pirellulales bacterium]